MLVWPMGIENHTYDLHGDMSCHLGKGQGGRVEGKVGEVGEDEGKEGGREGGGKGEGGRVEGKGGGSELGPGWTWLKH